MIKRNKRYRRVYIGGTCDKEVYNSNEEADRTANAYNLMNDIKQYSYKCDRCKLYHLTSKGND